MRVNSLIRNSISFAEKLNVLYAKNWTQLAHQHIRNYEEHLSELTADINVVEDILNPHQRWTFIRSFYYSLSLMTTIGKLVQNCTN